MELQGVSEPLPRAGRATRTHLLVAVGCAALAAWPAAAGASTRGGSAAAGATGLKVLGGATAQRASHRGRPVLSAGSVETLTATRTIATDPNTPVLVTDENHPPAGFRLTAAQVLRIALADPRVKAELRRHRSATPYEYTKGPGRWQVSWFSAGRNAKELMQVYVDDASGRVTEVWTGFQVAWTMARGYPGAFGRRVNALYVWLPLCALFVLPFLPIRIRGRRTRMLEAARDGSPGPVVELRRPSLLHLDLLMLLGFSVSLALFNHAKIGLSVPLAYPFLLYLLVRMLLLAFGRGRPRGPLRLFLPASWLAIAVVFLVGFRIGLNVTNSNVIDVGYAGVIGANKLLHGQHLYGGWPHDNANGDTYGPVNYYAYVPFKMLFGWSGTWDDLPAAHAAAIAFDLLTLLGLWWLGRLVRGPTTGTVLAYMWAAYPFTLYALSSNSNDSLVAMFVVLAFLVLRWAPARGAAGALAGLTKFAPLALAPLLLRGTGEGRPRLRSALAYAAAYLGAAAVVMLPVLLGDNWHAFWHDTISYQSGRGSPFSVWGLWGGLSLEQHLIQGAAVALAVAVLVVPRKRTIVQVAALGAAVLIALQLGITHWFYLYIPWFFPLVALALIASHPTERQAALAAAIELPDEHRGALVGAGA